MMSQIIVKGGRPKIVDYNDSIKVLRKRGFGSLLIQRELEQRGIHLSRGTINARLKEIDEQLKNEGYSIIHY